MAKKSNGSLRIALVSTRGKEIPRSKMYNQDDCSDFSYDTKPKKKIFREDNSWKSELKQYL